MESECKGAQAKFLDVGNDLGSMGGTGPRSLYQPWAHVSHSLNKRLIQGCESVSREVTCDLCPLWPGGQSLSLVVTWH